MKSTESMSFIRAHLIQEIQVGCQKCVFPFKKKTRLLHLLRCRRPPLQKKKKMHVYFEKKKSEYKYNFLTLYGRRSTKKRNVYVLFNTPTVQKVLFLIFACNVSMLPNDFYFNAGIFGITFS